MKQTKQVKKCNLTWIDDEANSHNLGTVETNNPVHALFSEVCKMIVGTTFFYDPKKSDTIIKDIWEGKESKRLGRESYYYEANDHVLSIMEVI